MPPQTGSTIIPSLRYRDAHAAIDWLVRVFGFHKQAVYEGHVWWVGSYNPWDAPREEYT